MDDLRDLVDWTLAQITADEEYADSLDDPSVWPEDQMDLLAEMRDGIRRTARAQRDAIEWALGVEALRTMGDPQAPAEPIGERALRRIAFAYHQNSGYRDEWRP